MVLQRLCALASQRVRGATARGDMSMVAHMVSRGVCGGVGVGVGRSMALFSSAPLVGVTGRATALAFHSMRSAARSRMANVRQKATQANKPEAGGSGGSAPTAAPKQPRDRSVTPTYAEFGQLTVAEKVVETSKDVGSTGVVLLALGVTGVILYNVTKELFNSESATTLYSRALDDVKSDDRVHELFGASIVGHGEGRRRAQQIDHVEYEVGDMHYLRMQFHLEGDKTQGIAHAEFKRRGSEAYRYRYLFVEEHGTQRQRVVLIDNRSEDATDRAGVPA
eukprot:m.486880 g.486880  ORF g.486880 m.486880 type:complete len:279 (-) comp24651_c0_seq1:85-921(-)